MKKVLILICLCFTCTYVYAGGVTDDNNNNYGDIFIGTGTNNGANSVGTWVNASDVPELKGDKGDKGDTGETGATGVSGEKGDKGNEGKQGVKGETGKGLKDRVNIMVGVEHEGKKWKQGVHGGYDVNNSVNILEVRFTRKIGKSYTEERLNSLQNQINELKGEEKELFEEDGLEIIPNGTGFIIRTK